MPFFFRLPLFCNGLLNDKLLTVPRALTCLCFPSFPGVTVCKDIRNASITFTKLQLVHLAMAASGQFNVCIKFHVFLTRSPSRLIRDNFFVKILGHCILGNIFYTFSHSIMKILNLYIIHFCTHLYHFFPVSILYMQ